MLANPCYLPKSTGDTLAYGEAIARDAKRLPAAAAYWQAALQALGETVLETGQFSSDAMAFAGALPDSDLATLIKEFSGFFDTADEGAMVSQSGCLMSGANLARQAYQTETKALDDELKFLGSYIGAPQGADKPDRERAARALVLVREVYDLVRRFTIATENARALKLPRSELIAIHRQEGALGLAPPQTSWTHAPLIKTTAQGCRSHDMHLWDVPSQGSTTRNAFVLSHEAETGVTPSLTNPVSARFGTLVRHLVVIAGADTLVFPRLQLDDELLAWYSQVRRAKAGTFPALDDLVARVASRLNDKPQMPLSIFERQSQIASQKAFFDGLAIGLIMLQVERAATTGALSEESVLIDAMAAEMQALLNGHAVLIETDNIATHISLAPADDFQDARACLSIQGRWYGSRKSVVTLLAVRDRAAWSGPAEWSPILAYLRYNIGEFNFLRLLCRFAARLKSYQSVAFQKSHGIAAGFAAALPAVGWTPVDSSQAEKMYQQIRDLAAKTNLSKSPGWRHLGLLDALAAVGPVCCKPKPPSPAMLMAANTARDALKLYADKGLLPLLDQFITTHPIRTLVHPDIDLVGFGPQESHQPTCNAFSFERLRRAYAQALVDAGLDEIPP